MQYIFTMMLETDKPLIEHLEEKFKNELAFCVVNAKDINGNVVFKQEEEVLRHYGLLK